MKTSLIFLTDGLVSWTICHNNLQLEVVSFLSQILITLDSLCNLMVLFEMAIRNTSVKMQQTFLENIHKMALKNPAPRNSDRTQHLQSDAEVKLI